MFNLFGKSSEDQLRRAQRQFDATQLAVGQNRINRANEMFAVMGPRALRQAREAGGARGMSSSSVAKQLVSDQQLANKHKGGELSDAQAMQNASMASFVRTKKALHQAAANRAIGNILSTAGFGLALAAPGIGSALGGTFGSIAGGLGQGLGMVGSSMGSGMGVPYMDFASNLGQGVFGGAKAPGTTNSGAGAVDPITGKRIIGAPVFGGLASIAAGSLRRT